MNLKIYKEIIHTSNNLDEKENNSPNFTSHSSSSSNIYGSKSPGYAVKALNHDIRNLLFSISGYISLGYYQKAQQKIYEICSILPNTEYKTITGDVCVDKLISSKIRTAERYGIKFKYTSNINGNIFIDRSELCTVIGNALDNSIEACSKIYDNPKREISINIFSSQNYLYINICNSVNSKVDSSLKTTKNDKQNHGIGIQSIKSISDKYKGSFATFQKGDKFYMDIKLNNLNAE